MSVQIGLFLWAAITHISKGNQLASRSNKRLFGKATFRFTCMQLMCEMYANTYGDTNTHGHHCSRNIVTKRKFRRYIFSISNETPLIMCWIECPRMKWNRSGCPKISYAHLGSALRIKIHQNLIYLKVRVLGSLNKPHVICSAQWLSKALPHKTVCGLCDCDCFIALKYWLIQPSLKSRCIY